MPLRIKDRVAAKITSTCLRCRIPLQGSTADEFRAVGKVADFDTFTVALVQRHRLMSVQPGPGVLFFAAVIVLTMIAAQSIWGAGVRLGEQHG